MIIHTEIASQLNLMSGKVIFGRWRGSSAASDVELRQWRSGWQGHGEEVGFGCDVIGTLLQRATVILVRQNVATVGRGRLSPRIVLGSRASEAVNCRDAWSGFNRIFHPPYTTQVRKICPDQELWTPPIYDYSATFGQSAGSK